MNLSDLKKNTPEELCAIAEKLKINPSAKTRDLIFSILKTMSKKGDIYGEGVLEILKDGFGFFAFFRQFISGWTG
jgi:transcription termination factor Rho